jgi:alkylation response protein AidB-like acyl-CoA dehydrogenase
MSIRFGPDLDERDFGESIDRLLRDTCPPEAVRAVWEEGGGIAPAAWRGLAEVGVLGLLVPEERGGVGAGLDTLALALEAVGRAACPGPVIEVAAVVAPVLVEVGDPHDWLPGLLDGSLVCAVGLGEEPWIAYGEAADVLLLCAGDELHGVRRADVELFRQPSVDGARPLWAVGWQPRSETLIAVGPEALVAARDRGAVAAASTLIGLGAGALAQTIAYVAEREQFGRPIATFQAVQHPLAEAHVRLEFARGLVRLAAAQLAGHAEGLTDDTAVVASMAKVAAGRAAGEVAEAALQAHGAMGYSFEYDLHLWLKRIWSLAAAWGDAGAHRARIAGHVLGTDDAKSKEVVERCS